MNIRPDKQQQLQAMLLNTKTTVAEAAVRLDFENETAWVMLDTLDLMDCCVCGKWCLMSTIVDDEYVECRH